MLRNKLHTYWKKYTLSIFIYKNIVMTEKFVYKLDIDNLL